MKEIHRLLIRQLKRNKIDMDNPSPEMESFLESISISYDHFESSKNLIDRAMEISNIELAEANSKLIEESKTQKYLIESLKESVKDISVDGKEIENNDLLQISQILKQEIEKRKELEKHLKSAQELAEESLKSKERFLANMSHEIRTPLNAILGMVWLLAKTNLNNKQNGYHEVLKTATENLLTIINDILDISKIDSGNLTVENIKFDLDKLLDDLTKSVSFKAAEKDIELIIERDDKIHKFLKGDPKKLTQILLNLVSNAIKFTKKGSVKIRVRLNKTNLFSDEIEFSVIDTGIGIEKKNLKSVFNSFSQEDASINRKYGGTGLGLTISKELASLLGSEILLESEKNIGSKFSFIVKMNYFKEVESVASITLESNQSTKNLKGCSVLIVEDDMYNRILLTSIFEDWNVRIGIAENGIEAIKKLSSESFDIVLMDMHMPQMDGLTATKEIRTKLKLTLPIISLTADVIQSKEKCLEAGMNDFISKPFNPNELYQIIEKYI